LPVAVRAAALTDLERQNLDLATAMVVEVEQVALFMEVLQQLVLLLLQLVVQGQEMLVMGQMALILL
jgi:hypothetical protein